jgi:glutathione S-transferase
LSGTAALDRPWSDEGENPMTITITAFERSPDRGKGLARDMRVRWALEEVGQPYDVRLLSFSAMKEPAHLALHPFGQIPTYEEGDFALFESGAIVFHIAERHAGLLPEDANARARAIAWMFAALSTVEPPIVDRDVVTYAERDKSWREERMRMIASAAFFASSRSNGVAWEPADTSTATRCAVGTSKWRSSTALLTESSDMTVVPVVFPPG